MIKNKIKIKLSKKYKIKNKYIIYKYKFIKKNFLIFNYYIYNLLIFNEVIKKNLFFNKKKNICNNICGSGGDFINLPNITTTDCLIFTKLKKKIFKNSGNSIFLKNGSIDYFVKIKFFNFYFLKYNFNFFINIKKMLNLNIKFRKKILINNFFNIINPNLNIFINRINVFGLYSLKLIFFYKFINKNYSVLLYNLCDDIIQKKEIFFLTKKKYFVNNYQYGIKKINLNKNIFSENLKFNLLNIKYKKNIFIFSKCFFLFFFKFKKIKKKLYFYFLLNNYLFIFLKLLIKYKNEQNFI